MVRLQLRAHVGQHLRPGVRLVPERSIEGIEQKNGERASIRAEIRPICVQAGRQGWHLALSSCNFRTDKGRDFLFLSVLFNCEIVRLQPAYRMALLVGHHHINEYQAGVDPDRRTRNLGFGLLGSKTDAKCPYCKPRQKFNNWGTRTQIGHSLLPPSVPEPPQSNTDCNSFE